MQGIKTCRQNMNMRSIIMFCGLILGICVSISLSGCGQPLRVATRGAIYYHQPDCKYAANSLAEHGQEKRVHYHDPLGVILSGRTPCPKCNAELGK